MQVLVYADELAREWSEMITGHGYAATVLLPGQPYICHPTHAVGALEELLHMTQALLAGVVVLGPLVAPLRAKHGRGGPYAVS